MYQNHASPATEQAEHNKYHTVKFTLLHHV